MMTIFGLFNESLIYTLLWVFLNKKKVQYSTPKMRVSVIFKVP